MPTASDDSDSGATSQGASKRSPRGAILALLLLPGACAVPGTTPDAEQEPLEYARTASEIKLALIEEENVDAAAVGVSVTEGSVTISGFVASEAERDAALQAVRARAGELDVVDELDVRD